MRQVTPTPGRPSRGLVGIAACVLLAVAACAPIHASKAARSASPQPAPPAASTIKLAMVTDLMRRQNIGRLSLGPAGWELINEILYDSDDAAGDQLWFADAPNAGTPGSVRMAPTRELWHPDSSSAAAPVGGARRRGVHCGITAIRPHGAGQGLNL